MTDRTEPTAFTRPIVDLIDRHGYAGGFVIVLPDYRPELLHGIARAAGLDFVDFRATVMARHGAAAGRIPLEALDEWIAAETAERGLALQNVEALLSTKSPAERRTWFARFLSTPWQRPVVVPIVIFGVDVPVEMPRALRIEAGSIPEETMLMRLWSSR